MTSARTPRRSGKTGEKGTASRDHLCAVVVLDDTIIGTMSWHAVFYGPTQGSRAWSMGIALAPEWRVSDGDHTPSAYCPTIS